MHKPETVPDLVDFYQRTKDYTSRIHYHNHPPDLRYPNGDPTPSGKNGDIGHAGKILEKSPSSTFFIYTELDDSMHEYYGPKAYESY